MATLTTAAQFYLMTCQVSAHLEATDRSVGCYAAAERRFGFGMMIAMKKLQFPVPVVTTDYLPGGGEIINSWVVWAIEDDAGTALSALSRYAAEGGASAVIAARMTTTAAAAMGASSQVAYGTAVTVAAA